MSGSEPEVEAQTSSEQQGGVTKGGSDDARVENAPAADAGGAEMAKRDATKDEMKAEEPVAEEPVAEEPVAEVKPAADEKPAVEEKPVADKPKDSKESKKEEKLKKKEEKLKKKEEKKEKKAAKKEAKKEEKLARSMTRRKKKHKKIDKQHPEFELTYDMMLGIRTVVSMYESKPLREVQVKDFKETIRLRFPQEGTKLTPAHEMRDFKFKEYAPEVFRHIRDLSGISAEEYLLTVCGDFQFLEFISNSKSGQFFFYTHERQYMIKTVSKDESKFLRKILPQYHHHLSQNPNTLLTKIYGMHRVKPHKKPERHFLIFSNVFNTRKFIHKTFDLKGSLVGRFATEKEKSAGHPVLKDQDFVNDGITINIGPLRAKLLKEQIERDVEFLRQLNIMDYSLLLGIHDGDHPDTDNIMRQQSFTMSAYTGNGESGYHAPPEHDEDAILEEKGSPRFTPLVVEEVADGEELSKHERRQSGFYALPKNYNQVSKPEDFQFNAPSLLEEEEHEQQRERVKTIVDEHAPHSLFTTDDGGVRGMVEGKESNTVYYMGIIDILTLYNTKKKLEHMAKSIKYDSVSVFFFVFFSSFIFSSSRSCCTCRQ